MKILLIDHDDSFTHILSHYLGLVSKTTPIVLNHKDLTIERIKDLAPTHLVLSPGPGHPDEYPIDKAILDEFKEKLPILGVCLGHQAIAQYFGAKIIHAPKVMHGKTSKIKHRDLGPMTVMRYHSLCAVDLPEDLELTSKSEDGVIMSFRHRTLHLQGFQFHPESFGTKNGQELIHSFIFDS